MKRGSKKENLGGRLGSEEIYRYWVEVRDLQSGSIRSLPLGAVTMVHIPRKKSEPQKPQEEILRLEDDSGVIEAKTLDDLATQLRERYSDERYVRTLHRQRDREAEERRANALSGFVSLIVESFVGTLSPEDAALLGRSLDTKEGNKALREIWPKIVDAYFHALCNPKQRSARSP